MKKGMFFVLIATIIMSLSNSSGRAIRGQGSTGAPGDGRRVCQSCHNSAEIQIKINAAVLDLNKDTISEYEPGVSYTLRVQIDTVIGQAKAYGMQAVCITDQLFLDAGTWDSVSHPLNVIYNPNTDRTYVEHFMPSDTNIFEATWIAPDTSVGPISFYIGGNGVNLNGTSSGDGGGTAKTSLMPAFTSSVKMQGKASDIVYPNPTSGKFNISKKHNEVYIYDAQGQKVRSYSSDAVDLNIEDLPNGLYWIQLIDRKSQMKYSKKLMKI